MMKANGHDKSTSRVNGHGSASSPPAALHTPLEKGRAASDDARDFPSAAATSAVAAGTGRDACAEVARPAKEEAVEAGSRKKDKPASGETSRASAEGNSTKHKSGQVRIPRGKEPLAADGPAFVDIVHQHVDLYLASARLVKSSDEKIAQRMLERLLELKFGKGPSSSGEESPEIVVDIDSAVARRAAEGATP
ncbi:MAG TPA: hypothetical protein VE077_07835 [Candidatus Methylomirabilis sp.]|nr:hypothetical protein [Candidatus Methylomirabilis sp.]